MTNPTAPAAGAAAHRAATPLRTTVSALCVAVVAALLALVTTAPPGTAAAPVGQGFNLNRSDLRFILRQIDIAERHSATRTPADPCSTLLGPAPDQIPNGNQQGMTLPWGLRTVDGSCNNLVPGRERWGAADTLFPRQSGERHHRAPYGQRSGTVTDAGPRLVSNLVVDQTSANPAAVEAAGATGAPGQTLDIPNVAPDTGLSAPYNSLFTLFGQFFDHGLDLVTKGGGTVFVPLQPGDPLYRAGSPTNFMLLTRATNQPGPDGVLGTADDVQEHTNTTTSYVDQNQTYTSHPAHQAFLREYRLDEAGSPVDTGRLLGGDGGDGLATWGGVKAQALSHLGVVLQDRDVLDVPMLATDPYGNLELSDAGRPQLVTRSGLVPTDPAGTALPADVLRTGHAFLDDIAHHATPVGRSGPLAEDADPGTTDDGDAATYDDEMLEAHYVAGDGRVNENIGLTAVHHVFHSEHNRLVADIDALLATETVENQAAWRRTSGPSGWDYGTRLFQAARFVTEMEYQHLVFEEFGRKVQPMVNLFGEGGTGYRTEIDASIRAEFAHAVYRFGHSMLVEDLPRRNADGSSNDLGLIEAFLNPPEFLDGGTAGTLTPDQAAGAVVRGTTRQVGAEIDEFVTEALRNNLLGLPLDLATLNIARARETGVPRLNEARRAFYEESGDSGLAPYTSWADLHFSLRNPGTLVNLIAAYGRHPDVVAATGVDGKRGAAEQLLDLAGQPRPVDPQTDEERALDAAIVDAYGFVNSEGAWAQAADGRTTTGVDDVDLWVGGLAEKPRVFGGMLGSTFNYVFETQMEDLQDGDRFYYLSRTAGLNLLTQLEGNSFAELVMRNTDAEGLPADAFSRPDFVFDVAKLGTSGAVTDDPGTTWTENTLLTRMPDRTIRFGGGEHVVFNGTSGADRVWSSEGDDTVRGNDGPDWAQGGDGNDNLIGGLGDDVLLDLAGDDTLKGGDGDDALSAGPGFGGDLVQGGRGNDFAVGGNDTTETFAGPGDDVVFAGDGTDTVFGDDGDDWIEDGKGPFSLLQGDNGAPFQDDPNEAGHDVLNGDGGEQDYDAEGGDDVMMAGPGIQRNEGMRGFDWVTHQGDPLPADSDMSLTGALPPAVNVNRDRFDLVEALSGWRYDDVLRGDDRTAADLAGEQALTTEGIGRVRGLAGLLPAGATGYDAGNILLGGSGSDLIEGRGGDDVIDGDAWLNARLSVRTDPADPSTEIGSTDGMKKPYRPGSTVPLHQDVLAGKVDPGGIVIVRELLSTPASTDVDTVVFSGARTGYTITEGPDGLLRVTDTAGTDGADLLRGIERLQFTDVTLTLAAPAAPTGVTATAGDAQATVRWTAGTSTTITPVLEHRVQVLVDGVVVRTVGGLAAGATSAVVTGLTNGTAHTFRVVAVNSVGESAPSEPSAPVTPLAPPPAATGSQPASGATGVLVGVSPQVTFGRAVTGASTASVTLTRVATGAGVPITVATSPDGRTVVADPTTNLAAGTQYRLVLRGTLADGSAGITGADGGRIAETTVLFTTNADGTAPRVTSTTPAAGATNVVRTNQLVVNTSERVLGVSTATFQVRRVLAGGALGAPITGTVASNGAGTRWTFNPAPPLASQATYQVTLTGGPAAIRDAVGNPLTGNGGSATTYTWRFTTRL